MTATTITDLIRWIIVLFQVRMCQRLFDGDSFVRVKRQHLVQQIQRCMQQYNDCVSQLSKG